MESWNNFFLGEVGAAAALCGLLFVAISINLEKILSAAALPGRALVALSMVLAIFVISSLMLIPGIPPALLGLASLFVGVSLAGLSIRVRTRVDQSEGRLKSIGNILFSLAAIAPYAIGGVLIIAGQLQAGLYFIAASIVLAFVKAVLDAWVLLVEIQR